MFRVEILLFQICLALCAGVKYRENNRDCKVANFPGARNVDFRKVKSERVNDLKIYLAGQLYPDLFYHQINFGNQNNILRDGVSFINRLTDDTISSYAVGRNGTTLECGVEFLMTFRNFPAGSSTLRITIVNIPEPSTQTFLIAAFDHKSHIMIYQCLAPLDSKGACPRSQSLLYVQTTTEKLSKRIFRVASSIARRLCIDSNEVIFLRDRPPCPKALELRAKHERRMRKMKNQKRGYGHLAW